MTESFLEGMKGLFENHSVTIPEEKYDVVESMVDKLDEMETKLNEQIEEYFDQQASSGNCGGILSDVIEKVDDRSERSRNPGEGVEFECLIRKRRL